MPCRRNACRVDVQIHPSDVINQKSREYRTFLTTQALGLALCPMEISTKDIATTLQDSWINLVELVSGIVDNTMTIPQHTHHQIIRGSSSARNGTSLSSTSLTSRSFHHLKCQHTPSLPSGSLESPPPVLCAEKHLTVMGQNRCRHGNKRQGKTQLSRHRSVTYRIPKIL